MILSNFNKIIFESLSNADGNVICINGETNSSPCYFNSDVNTFNYIGGNEPLGSSKGNILRYFSMTFGSGTTAPTEDDYQMESPYNTTDHFSFDYMSMTHNSEALTRTYVATITNTSDENLTVSELGIVTNYSTNHIPILLARSVITPVTIKPLETKTFQYTFDLLELTE